MAGRFSVEAVFKAVDRITAPVSRMQNRIGKLTRSMSRGFRKVNKALDSVVGGLRRGATAAIKFGVVGIGALTGAITLLVREFSKVEDAQAAFTPLLGGVEKAKKLVQELNDTASSTPFQFENLSGAASQLLPVMNGDIQNTIKTIRMLGDTAGGNAQKLESITRGFTKAMLKGKVDMESLNMIAEAGVPIFTELADSMGTKVNKSFFKMISAGRVTTKQLTAAFEKMTSKGGVFFGGMEIASKTTSGLFSTLKDNISLTAAELGGVLAPTVKDLLRGSTDMARKIRDWVTNNRELISTRFVEFVEGAKKAVKRLVDSIRTLDKENSIFDRLKKFVTVLTDAIIFLGKHGATIAKIIAGVVALSLSLKALSVVIAIVNLVMAANPIGLIIIAIAALIAGIAAAIIWWDELKAAFLGLPGPVKVAIALLAGPLSLIIGAANLIMENWKPLKQFFSDLWGGIASIFESKIEAIMAIVNRVKSAAKSLIDINMSIGKGVGGLFGLGDDDTQQKPGPQIVSPQERVARSIEEQRTTNTAEVTIRDESGRAEITGGKLGAGIALQPSGAF